MQEIKQNFGVLFRYVKEVVTEYISGDVIKHSASLSYYTTLSIVPLLIIIISVTGWIFGEDAMRGQVYSQMHELIGSEAASQLEKAIQTIHLNEKGSSLATYISIGVLAFGATRVFAEIQDSMNKIWGLKVVQTKKWWKVIVDRLISFSMVISLGFLMMVSLVLSAIVLAITSIVNKWLGNYGEVLIAVTDHLMSVISTTAIFAAIFKVLPDAHIKWRDVFIGALITSILFLIGKILIGYYIGNNDTASMFGAAGSVIILMLWVYYTSAILYLGAVFTKVYATNHGGKIRPSGFAVWIKTVEQPVSDVTLTENTNKQI